MDIIEFIVSEIVRNDFNAKSYIRDKETFLKVFIEEYAYISTKEPMGRMQMITNPEVIIKKLELHDMKELQEIVSQHLYKQLYLQNKISESEYEEACQYLQ